MTSQAIEVEVQSLQSFGNFYAKFLDPSQEKTIGIRQRLSNIKELEVGTSYPLLLRLVNARHAGYLSDVDLDKCLGSIESFVVRRAVCRVPSRSLSTMFIQWAKNFPDTDRVQWLHRALSSGINSGRFPTDREFAVAFTTHKQYGLANIGFILRYLERSFNHKEPVDLSTSMIEHILPQTMTQKWKDKLGLDAENVHSRLIDTFGNLTLTSYNSELGNLQFSEKKDKLKNTHIELNRWIFEQNKWHPQEIEERANILLSIANKIWLSPTDS